MTAKNFSMRTKPINIIEAMQDRLLLGAALGDIGTYDTWLVAIKSMFGIGLITDNERETFEQIAGGRAPPTHRIREGWLMVGAAEGRVGSRR
jgi:hypothetical protein